MLKIGSRVELPSHLDEWAQGDRYGYITDTFLNPAPATFPVRIVHYAVVRLDKSGRLVKISLDSLRGV